MFSANRSVSDRLTPPVAPAPVRWQATAFSLSPMNPWHDIDPRNAAPELLDCVIEIPRGGRLKYELDKNTGLLRLDRVLFSAVFYPANYGFIPRTYCDDKDPLDILVLGQEPVMPLCILTARPIGVMQMVDQDEEDDKIIAVHEHDPAYHHLRDISELPDHTLQELQRFFEDYKALELKQVRIERFKNREGAQKIIDKAFELYQETFDFTPDPIVPQPVEEPKSSGGTPSMKARLLAAKRAANVLSEGDAQKRENPGRDGVNREGAEREGGGSDEVDD